MKSEFNEDRETSALISRLPDDVVGCSEMIKSRLVELFSCKLLAAHKKQLSTHLIEILPKLPDPIQALNILSILFQRIESKNQIAYLFSEPVLHHLLTLFSFSGNFSNFILKYPNIIADIFPIKKEAQKEMSERYNKITIPPDSDAKKWLRLFETTEFIRIALSDYLKLDSFQE